jgi:hypothetical protein
MVMVHMSYFAYSYVLESLCAYIVMRVVTHPSFAHFLCKFTIKSVGPHIGSTYSMVNLPISCTEVGKRWKLNISHIVIHKFHTHTSNISKIGLLAKQEKRGTTRLQI